MDEVEYLLWYPFNLNEKVSDVASFFVSENVTSAKDMAKKYGADYSLGTCLALT